MSYPIVGNKPMVEIPKNLIRVYRDERNAEIEIVNRGGYEFQLVSRRTGGKLGSFKRWAVNDCGDTLKHMPAEVAERAAVEWFERDFLDARGLL